MSGTLELDESGTAAGPVTISTGALTFTYDKNDMGALAVASTKATSSATVWDGEADNYGDYATKLHPPGHHMHMRDKFFTREHT